MKATRTHHDAQALHSLRDEVNEATWMTERLSERDCL